MEPWPADKTNRSRLNRSGLAGLCFIKRDQSVYAMGAAPIGIPGCPELAFSTPSIDSMRMVFTASCSMDWLVLGISLMSSLSSAYHFTVIIAQTTFSSRLFFSFQDQSNRTVIGLLHFLHRPEPSGFH